MNNKWLFKIDLNDITVIDEYEKEYDVVFPTVLRSFIIDTNAASPMKNSVDINGVERVYVGTLSFNRYEEDASTFISAMKAIGDKGYLPFAKDPFGNYFCYRSENGTVSFYNHEEDSIDNSNIGFDEFVEALS